MTNFNQKKSFEEFKHDMDEGTRALAELVRKHTEVEKEIKFLEDTIAQSKKKMETDKTQERDLERHIEKKRQEQRVLQQEVEQAVIKNREELHTHGVQVNPLKHF